MATVPAATPVNVPVGETVATDVLLLLQVPPLVALVRANVEPAATAEPPPIAPGAVFTTTFVVVVAEHPPDVVLVTLYIPFIAAPASLNVGEATDDVKPAGPDHA